MTDELLKEAMRLQEIKKKNECQVLSLIHILQALIEDLEENEKKVVRMILFQNMKQTEAAEVIGVSQCMISRYYRSGIQKLRQCI